MAYVLYSQPQFFRAPLGDSLDMILDEALTKDTLDKILVLLPTGRRERYVRRMLVGSKFKRSQRPVAGLPLFTLEKFVLECSRRLLGPRQPRLISEAYSLALLEEAAGKAQLPFFKGTQKELSNAALRRLGNVIFGLKEDGVSPQSLRMDLEEAADDDDGGVDRARLADIAELFEAYESALGDKLADYVRLLQLTTDCIGGKRDTQTLQILKSPDSLPLAIVDRWQELWPDKQAIILDGFSEFKKPEQEFLALLGTAHFHTRILLDYSAKNGPLFANLQETVEHLQDVGFRAVSSDAAIEEEADYRAAEHLPEVSYLRRWLFNTEQEIHHEGFNDNVMVLALPNRMEEVRAIARLVKHLAQEQNIPLADIVIVMRQPQIYSALFREIFNAYDVPSNVTDRFSMAKSPVSIAVFAFLDVALNGFRRQDVHRALQSPYARITRLERGRELELDAANLYSVALRLRISGGARRGGAFAWVSRLEKRIDYLKRRAALLATESYPDPDEERETGRELLETERALADFLALRDWLPDVERRMSSGEFAAMVKTRMLRDLQVRESILQFHERSKAVKGVSQIRKLELMEEVEKDARAFTAFLALLDELAYIYEERYPGAKRPCRDYVERLRTAAQSQRYQVREKLGFGVTITSIEQIRNIPFRVTIVCGVVDGEFPAVYMPESFLGKELPETEERFLKRERLQFYQALTNGAEHFSAALKQVYITYPRFRDSEELVRSPFLDALLKVSTLDAVGRVIDVAALWASSSTSPADLPADLNFLTAIASGEEMLHAVGRLTLAEGDAEPESGIPSLVEKLLLLTSDEARRSEASRVVHTVRTSKARALQETAPQLLLPELTPAAQESLRRTAERPFSVSVLELYAKCPFQFFADRMLALERREEFDTMLSPLERGSFLHRILFRFYRHLQDEQRQADDSFVVEANQAGLPPIITVWLDPNEADRYLALLRKIAEEESEHIHFDHPFFEIEKEELLGGDHQPGKLQLWLREELKRVSMPWGFQPALFEFAFGGRGVEGQGFAIPPIQINDDLRLRGKVDRIEIAPVDNAANKPALQFMIGDYKTGVARRLPGNADIARGVSFQMPLYTVATAWILREYYQIEALPLASVYYSLTPEVSRTAGGVKSDSHRFVLLPKDTALGATVKRSSRQVVENEAAAALAIEQSVESASRIVRDIGSGRFPVDPFDPNKVCAYCHFQAVCRIKESLNRH